MLMKQQLEAISIAERIRSLMGRDTEAAFAHRLGIAPHSVAVCLQGRVPDPGTLARISEVCEASLDWLLHGSRDGEVEPAAPEDKTVDAAARTCASTAKLSRESYGPGRRSRLCEQPALGGYRASRDSAVD